MKLFSLIMVISLINIISLQGQNIDSGDSITFMIDGPNSKALSLENSPMYIISLDTMEFRLTKDDNLNNLNKIESSWIKSIDVLRSRRVIEKYGSDGENGVVLIKLNKDSIESLSSFLQILMEND